MFSIEKVWEGRRLLQNNGKGKREKTLGVNKGLTHMNMKENILFMAFSMLLTAVKLVEGERMKNC